MHCKVICEDCHHWYSPPLFSPLPSPPLPSSSSPPLPFPPPLLSQPHCVWNMRLKSAPTKWAGVHNLCTTYLHVHHLPLLHPIEPHLLQNMRLKVLMLNKQVAIFSACTYLHVSSLRFIQTHLVRNIRLRVFRLVHEVNGSSMLSKRFGSRLRGVRLASSTTWHKHRVLSCKCVDV